MTTVMSVEDTMAAGLDGIRAGPATSSTQADVRSTGISRNGRLDIMKHLRVEVGALCCRQARDTIPSGKNPERGQNVGAPATL
jgi:hypothetical protein